MIPALPLRARSPTATPRQERFTSPPSKEGDTPHHVGEYRIETVLRALRALQACGYDDVEVGSIFAPDPEHVHLLLTGLDGEARVGDRQLGCIAVAPGGGWSRCGRILVTSTPCSPPICTGMVGRRWLSTTPNL